MYIAVSGNLGSGKTTIARALANAFNCQLYPRRSYDTSYIEDLFREPKRWTAEAQIAFMVHKHDAIREGMDRGRLFVLDRSFSEDVSVFAERFHEDGVIEPRSMELIRRLASDLEARLDPPALIVYCDCPVTICEQRLATRQRSYQNSYPSDHLRKLDLRLQAWLTEQEGVPLIKVRTDRIDFRKTADVNALAKRVDLQLRSRQHDQLDLFEAISNDSASRLIYEQNEIGHSGANISSRNPSLLQPKLVYLAAPFTGRATRQYILNDAPAGLFSGDEYLERIPRYYRNQLIGIARAIESHGYAVLLPHRDINRWGKRSLPASEIARRCLDGVKAADYYIGLVGESFGSHAELGYALGLGKPSIVLTTGTLPMSFFGTGITSMSGVGNLHAPSLPKLIAELRRKDPLELVAKRAETQ